jgi:hypothetical protein
MGEAMTISAEDAGAMLAEIELIRRRVQQSSIYRASSMIVMGWGAIIFVGNLAGIAAGRWTGAVWIALDALGVLGTIVIVSRTRKNERLGASFLAAFALFVAFGLVWSLLIGHFRARELDVFWPTLFLFGYALAGLLFGRAFTAIGVGLSAVIVAGYLSIEGVAFNVFLAIVHGGGLILCGLWMRRV